MANTSAVTRGLIAGGRSRRSLLASLVGVPVAWCAAAVFFAPPTARGQSPGPLRVATFRCDVTPPLGEPMISCDAIRTIEQPLLAKGIVLEAAGKRYVLCSVDWCELCNAAYDSMRARIASAAGTDPSGVALQTVHQHTAPVVDTAAQKLLAEAGLERLHLSPTAYEQIEDRLAAAVRQSLAGLQPFDRVGTGQAKVDRVAATRRPVDAAGKIRVRYSTCKDPSVRALDEGTIDPYVKTITLARGDKPLVRLHYYATHPQTPYGDGRASSDFVGEAREALEKKEGVFQIYFTGCGGDITVGKYNDGSKQCRVELARRMLAGLEASVAATRLVPAGPVRWRTHPLLLRPRTDAGFSADDCIARMKNPKVAPALRAYAGAVRIAFHQRKNQPIECTSLQIGDVYIVNLPGEPMLCFQTFAQAARPGGFVAVAGYGDCATGYICPAKAFQEGGYEPTDANVEPGSEVLLKKAIASLLGVESAPGVAGKDAKHESARP